MTEPLAEYTEKRLTDEAIKREGATLSRFADKLCHHPAIKDKPEILAAITNEYNAIIDEIQEPWAARTAKRQGRRIA